MEEQKGQGPPKRDRVQKRAPRQQRPPAAENSKDDDAAEDGADEEKVEKTEVKPRTAERRVSACIWFWSLRINVFGCVQRI